MALAQCIPNLRGVDGGTLDNARYVEEITALLLNINRIHGAQTYIRIEGLEPDLQGSVRKLGSDDLSRDTADWNSATTVAPASESITYPCLRN